MEINGSLLTLPLFRKKTFMWQSFALAMFGAVSSLLLMIHIVIIVRSGDVVAMDHWIGLGAAFLIFTMFLPLSIILFFANIVVAKFDEMERILASLQPPHTPEDP